MKRTLGSSLLAATLALTASIGFAGQTPATQTPTYDVVSIKPAPANATGMSVATLPGGRFTMSNGDARMLVQMAYPSRTNELVGAPAWLRERFDVEATSSITTPTEEQRMLMMRALMTDRFKLAAHYEPKEIDAFALMLAREDGRLGPQIHRAEFDCEAISAARARGEQPPPLTKADGSPGCGSRGRPGVLTFGGTSMAGLAGSLSSAAGRLVVDKTGLAGRYDVTLEYTARTSRDAPAGAAPPPSEDRPDIATALREQLGFKLVPEKTTVQIVVIDHIERPTEN